MLNGRITTVSSTLLLSISVACTMISPWWVFLLLLECDDGGRGGWFKGRLNCLMWPD